MRGGGGVGGEKHIEGGLIAIFGLDCNQPEPTSPCKDDIIKGSLLCGFKQNKIKDRLTYRVFKHGN